MVLSALSRVRRVRNDTGPVWRGRAGATDVLVVQSGVGFARAEAATSRFVSPPDLIVSVGFAGALRAKVDVGTLVVCTRVLWEDAAERVVYEVPPRLVASLRNAAKGPMIEGPLLSSPVVLSTATAKAAAGESYGAVAVEMEAAALARYSGQHGIPFLPVRAVLDPMELSLGDLPAGIETSWAARARVVMAPSLWPRLRLLREHAVRATDVLGGVCRPLLRTLGEPG